MMTNEEEDLVRDLVSRCGLNDREVGELMGRAKLTIMYVRRRLGLEANRKSVLPVLSSPPFEIKPITKTLRKYYPASSRPPEKDSWEEWIETATFIPITLLERDIKMAEMRELGSTLKEIGIKFSLSRERVRQILKKHGWMVQRKFYLESIREHNDADARLILKWRKEGITRKERARRKCREVVEANEDLLNRRAKRAVAQKMIELWKKWTQEHAEEQGRRDRWRQSRDLEQFIEAKPFRKTREG